ncbi:MAG: cupin domain-containing protein [Thermoanaerobaculia bacterium]
MKRTATLAVGIAILLAGILAAQTAAIEKKTATGKKTPAAHEGIHVVFAPGDIKWSDAPPILPAGAKIAVLEGDPSKAGPLTMRLKFPAGYKIAPHWHPGIERVTVVSGTFNLGLGDKFDDSKGNAMPAGSFGFLAPRMHHFAWTKGETEIQVHTIAPWKLVYVDPADDPSKKK